MLSYLTCNKILLVNRKRQIVHPLCFLHIVTTAKALSLNRNFTFWINFTFYITILQFVCLARSKEMDPFDVVSCSVGVQLCAAQLADWRESMNLYHWASQITSSTNIMGQMPLRNLLVPIHFKGYIGFQFLHQRGIRLLSIMDDTRVVGTMVVSSMWTTETMIVQYAWRE